MTPQTNHASAMTLRPNHASAELQPRRARSRAQKREWKSEHIPADDPFARFAAMAQRILVKRVIAANRTHWRKYNERENRKRDARELAHQLSQQPAPQPAQQKDATR
jgi:hypothetical protein